MNDFSWNLLDWEYCCDQAPGVYDLFQRVNEREEYGIEWSVFLRDYNHATVPLVQKWWDSLPKERKRELLTDTLRDVDARRNRLEAALENIS